MIPDLNKLIKSFLLPHRRTLAQRLSVAAIRSGYCFVSAAKQLYRARRYGAEFPEGCEDAPTIIAQKVNLHRHLWRLNDRMDGELPIKPIWVYYKATTRGVNPKHTAICLELIRHYLVEKGGVSARDAYECSDTFHGLLCAATSFCRAGWTPESGPPPFEAPDDDSADEADSKY